jgi:hypothetical protein
MESRIVRLNVRHSEGEIKQYYYNQVVKLWRECVRVFVFEASNRIAIDTGMSAASLFPLAAKVQIKNILRDAVVSGGLKPGHKNLIGRWDKNNAKYKSMALGQRLGQKAFVLDFGTVSAPEFKFSFHIVVFQHWLHEDFGNYSNSECWNSLLYGKVAFLDYWKNHFKEFVKAGPLCNWLIRGRISE